MSVTQPHSSAMLDPMLEAGFVELIRERFGLSISYRQSAQLAQAVREVLPGSACETPDTLYRLFTAGHRLDLLDAVAARLTVGETHFYRVRPQIQALRDTILPELRAGRTDRRSLRIWIAGCSTGEEAYTVAMLLREQLPMLSEWNVRLLATDLNEASLVQARNGCYGAWSFRETPDDVRERHFVPEGKRWRLAEPVRRMVAFERVNLVDNPLRELGLQAGGIDLILCRNVTIYFHADATQELYRQFTAALAPGGWLVLGPSDPPPSPGGALQPVYLPGAVVWRKGKSGPEAEGASRPVPVRALPPVPRRPSPVQQSRPARPRPALLPAAPPPPGTQSGELDHLRVLAGTDRNEALVQAERLIQAGTLEPDVHLLAGMMHLDAGDLLPAVENLRRAAFLEPGNVLAHFTLGRAYAQLGYPERARVTFFHTRRLLATAEDVPGLDGDGLTIDDLRYAVEVQLGQLGSTGEG